LFKTSRPADGTGNLKRVLVLQDGQISTTPAALHLVRSWMEGSDVPIGVGTNADLYQLNLQRPPGGEADFVFWSMNPQVHTFDNESLARTPAGAADQVRSVRNYFPGKPACVTPVTLKPRFNPVATTTDAAANPQELPANVDVRQLSLFGAAWTLAMLKHLAEAGAASVTFFETVGWRGVMEQMCGPLLPGKFPSSASSVFPLYHVFADVAGFKEFTQAFSSRPTIVPAMTLWHGRNRGRLLLANLGAETRRVRLNLPGKTGALRMLDQTNVLEAMRQPESWRHRPMTPVQVADGVRLLPFGLACLDF